MSKPTGHPIIEQDAVAALGARQAEIDQICTFTFGGTQAAEVTRLVLEVAARYRIGATRPLKGKARIRKFETQANAAKLLRKFFLGLDANDLTEMMLAENPTRPSSTPDDGQSATWHLRPPLRGHALLDANTLIKLLNRAEAGLRHAVTRATSLPVGHPERPDPVAFLVESLHAIWMRFGQGKPATQSKRRDEFGGFVAACEELVAQATGMSLKKTTIQNAVIAHLRSLSAAATSPG